MKKKILVVFGTRPEAIKLASLIWEFKRFSEDFEVKVCVTGQHRSMLDQMLTFFKIVPDYDLDLMAPSQDLLSLTSLLLISIKPVLEEVNPDYVFVQGDTTSSVAVAMAAFYLGIKVCHVEAGLRTHDKKTPFPEELNRQITSRIADYHFAPSERARANLLKENIPSESIIVTGNTGIDAFLWTLARVEDFQDKDIDNLKRIVMSNNKIILVTSHRRENFGNRLDGICQALADIANEFEVEIIYPIHLNPNVQEIVLHRIGDIANIHLLNPLSYPSFVWLIKRSFLILTDSGGIQEEAPYIGKPVLVMRESTEREEILETGNGLLVGTNPANIVKKCRQLLIESEESFLMRNRNYSYGLGDASEQIVKAFKLLQHV